MKSQKVFKLKIGDLSFSNKAIPKEALNKLKNGLKSIMAGLEMVLNKSHILKANCYNRKKLLLQTEPKTQRLLH